MATRAEKFRIEAERRASASKKHPLKIRGSSAGSKAARAALVARADGTTAGIPHNAAARVARKTSYELETSRTGRSPRKSTRKSPTHVKADDGLRGKTMRRNASPETRATRRARKAR